MRNLRNRRANPSPSVLTLFGTKERVLSSASRFCSTTPKTVLFKETPLTDVYIIHGSPAKQNEWYRYRRARKWRSREEGRREGWWLGYHMSRNCDSACCVTDIIWWRLRDLKLTLSYIEGSWFAFCSQRGSNALTKWCLCFAVSELSLNPWYTLWIFLTAVEAVVQHSEYYVSPTC